MRESAGSGEADPAACMAFQPAGQFEKGGLHGCRGQRRLAHDLVDGDRRRPEQLNDPGARGIVGTLAGIRRVGDRRPAQRRCVDRVQGFEQSPALWIRVTPSRISPAAAAHRCR